MNGPDFKNVFSIDNSNTNVRNANHSDKQSVERKQRIAELKSKVESGQYHVDLQLLAKKVVQSGVLAND